MQTRFEMPVYVNMSLADGSSRLGLANTFGLFLDLATIHAEQAGIGTSMMQQTGLFWVTARTHAHFYKRPRLTQTVQAETFLGEGHGPKVIRYYRIRSGEEVCVEGKTDFAALNLQTGKLLSVEDFYPRPEELPVDQNGRRDTACENLPDFATARIHQDFSGPDVSSFGTYTVRSVDIDLGGHMDNVAYVYAFLGLFSTQELKQARFNDIDIVYLKPCFEGQALTAYRRPVQYGPDTASGYELAFVKQDGQVCTLLRLLSY